MNYQNEKINERESPNQNHKEIPGNPSTATSSNLKLNNRTNGKPLKVLSEDDWKFWMHNGYIVIKNAVSREQASQTANFLWEFEEKDPNDPNTWYAPPRAEMEMKELAGTGMVEVYNNQALWNNRQAQKIYEAFTDIWGTDQLWATIDRANLNFPIKPGFEYKGFIHWDYDPETKPQNVQGVLALAMLLLLCNEVRAQLPPFQQPPSSTCAKLIAPQQYREQCTTLHCAFHTIILKCNAVKCSADEYSALQWSPLQCSAVLVSSALYI